MGYTICIPGGGPALDVGPYTTMAEAVDARDRLWGSTSWGGQSLVIVNETTGEVVRPCLWCRGRGSVEGRTIAGAFDCKHCGGSGVDDPAVAP